MGNSETLYKTTVVIWTTYNPEMELEDLAREATRGNGYCSKQVTENVVFARDPDWDGTEFFKQP